MGNIKKTIVDLNDEELAQVNGGSTGGTETRVMWNSEFSGHVNKYSAVVGRYYYATDDNSRTDWIYGEMLRTYEKSFGPCATKRVHVIRVTSYGGNCSKGEKEILGDSWTLYTTRKTFL